MRILLLEDDPKQAEGITLSITDRFDAEVVRIATESEFRLAIRKEFALSADLAVLDVMVRWTDPSLNMPRRPEDVCAEGPPRAGLRCLALLREVAPEMPVIAYTILEEDDLSEDLISSPAGKARGTGPSVLLRKDGDRTPLIEGIEHLLSAND
ncbi:MAG: hypothetical protein RH917_00365 [Lacipirellulaceae bacterium]